jgi:hypothetical protein
MFYNERDFNTPCSWISGYSGLNYINPTFALRHVFGLSQWSTIHKFVICQVLQHSKLKLLILYQQMKVYTNSKITPLSAEASIWLLMCGRTRYDPWQTFLYAPLSTPDVRPTQRPEDLPSGPKMAAACSSYLTFHNTEVKNMSSMRGIKRTDVFNFYHLNR